MDDYSFFNWGLLEMYDTTQDPKYVKLALEQNDQLLQLFWDDDEGGSFFTAVTVKG